MKNIMYYAAGLLLCVAASCNHAPKFTIEGNISGAKGKTIYLEQSGIHGIVALDSARLKDAGKFHFQSKAPEAPDFYRIRIENKAINFSIDSTESIRITADYKEFPINYQIEGSENNLKIKELAFLQIQLQNQVDAITSALKKGETARQTAEDSIRTVIQAYKDKIKREYIYKAPNKAYAYYALFQEINGYLLFDPFYNREDIKCFAAVATSFNNLYPHAIRSKNLYNMVIKGMQNTHTPTQATGTQAAEPIAVTETGIIDINLRDPEGNERKLSELKGKVVLLDFTAYQTAMSVSHNFTLRELYDKYAAQGLEIYQVSLDADEHFWRTAADNLPWTCVHAPDGIYSDIVSVYNIQALPTCFLINRNNELSAREDKTENLEKAIKELL